MSEAAITALRHLDAIYQEAKKTVHNADDLHIPEKVIQELEYYEVVEFRRMIYDVLEYFPKRGASILKQL